MTQATQMKRAASVTGATELLTIAYLMELETVANYLAASANLDGIEPWEREGGAVAAESDLPGDGRPVETRGQRTQPAAHRVSDALAVEFDDLEPSPPAGHIGHDDIAHPPAEQRCADRRLIGDLARLGVALA